MKNNENPRKVKLIILVFAVALLFITVITGKSGTLNNIDNTDQDEIELLENYYNALIEQNNETIRSGKDTIIKVIDKENALVAKGKEKDTDIIHLISKSDFLIEIDGKKYYRLSFK